jgi:hypothetical protein
MHVRTKKCVTKATSRTSAQELTGIFHTVDNGTRSVIYPCSVGQSDLITELVYNS